MNKRHIRWPSRVRVMLGYLSFIGISVVAGNIQPAAACEVEEVSAEPVNYSSEIALSEVYPAPGSDEEEYIELLNGGDDAVDLAGWQLADDSGKIYTIDTDDFTSTVVGADEYLVVGQSISKIYLNNGGDSVLLYQPDGTLLDETTYEDSETAYSWIYVNQEWRWSTTSTEGELNVYSAEEAAVESTEETEREESGAEDSSAETTETYDATKVETSDSIVLNEMLPNPAGVDSTDEWIELMNTGNEDVYLGGWQLTDESKYYTIGDVTLTAGERLLFEVGETSISLNNSGDTVYLIDPNGVIAHGTTYGSASEEESWARNGDSWEWTTTPTPAEENVFDAAVSEDEANEESGGENSDGETASGDIDVVSIDILRSLDDETEASVEGVVTVLPGVFGSQYFYMQDDSSGVQVYSYKKDFPELAVGDRLRVSGTKSQSRGEVRLKITSSEDIVVLESDVVVTPRDTDVLEESLEGVLVQVSGEVVEASSSAALLDDAVQIALKKTTGIGSDALEEGKQATVIGIVTQSNDSYRLQPRSEDDILLEEGEEIAWVTPAEAAGTAPSQLSGNNSGGSESILTVLVIVGLLLMIGGYKFQEWKRKTNEPDAAGRTQPSARKKGASANTSSSSKSIFEELREQARKMGT